jgi:hypothetical protein
MVVCPICEKNDQLRKISSIVDIDTHKISSHSQTWVSSEYGEHFVDVRLTDAQQSELARKLALPPIPVKPAGFTIAHYVSQALLGIIFWVVIFFIVVCISLFIKRIPENIVILITILGFIVPVLFIVASTLRYRSRRESYSVNKPIWDKAWFVWNRLYYCFRDNKIYDPETNETLDIQDLHEYIFTK